MSIRRISLECYSGSLVECSAALPDPAQHLRLRDGARRDPDRRAGREALETNWVKLELIGDPRCSTPMSSSWWPPTSGAQRICRAALLQRGPVDLPESWPMSVAPRSMPRVADRVGARHRQSGGDRADLPAQPGAGGARCRDRYRVRRGAGDAARLRRGPGRHRDRQTARPIRMAAAMQAGVEAGRFARLAGRIPKRTFAEPSSPNWGSGDAARRRRSGLQQFSICPSTAANRRSWTDRAADYDARDHRPGDRIYQGKDLLQLGQRRVGDVDYILVFDRERSA